jgi:hypothetical protein
MSTNTQDPWNSRRFDEGWRFDDGWTFNNEWSLNNAGFNDVLPGSDGICGLELRTRMDSASSAVTFRRGGSSSICPLSLQNLGQNLTGWSSSARLPA